MRTYISFIICIILFLPFIIAEPSIQQEEYSITLNKGWNLVSAPVAESQILPCRGIECHIELPINLNTMDCTNVKVFSYDSSGNRDITNRLYQEIHPKSGWLAGKAYWVKTNTDCTMTFDAKKKMTPAILSQGTGWHLIPGWNAIGAPINNIEFSKLAQHCDIKAGPYRFNTQKNRWEKAQVLKPGEGYFVQVSTDCSLSENIPSKKYCEKNSDCICGGLDKADQTCFVGNKDYYNTNVDKGELCPDFCTGSSGRLHPRCIQNECKIVDTNSEPQ